MTDPREPLGRLVREVWVEWAREQSDARPSWLAGWDDLDDGQREVDMRIGAAVASAAREQIRQHPVSACCGADYLTHALHTAWTCRACGEPCGLIGYIA